MENYIITYYDVDGYLFVEEFKAYNPTDAICQFEQSGLGHQEDIVSIIWRR